MEKIMIISSDGHATGRVDDYAPYIDPAYREEFAAYCVEFKKEPRYAFEPEVFRLRADPEVVDEWTREVSEPGRMDGKRDADRRILEMDIEGVAADIIFPDFGKPFEMYSATQATQLGEIGYDFERKNVSNRAYNRWLADFVGIAPERFAPMAMVEFDDVDAAVKEITWARNAGFKGMLCPAFDEDAPLFDSKFDPIWSTMEDLNMILNSHGGMSSTSRRAERAIAPQSMPHPACPEEVLSEPESDLYPRGDAHKPIAGALL